HGCECPPVGGLLGGDPYASDVLAVLANGHVSCLDVPALGGGQDEGLGGEGAAGRLGQLEGWRGVRRWDRDEERRDQAQSGEEPAAAHREPVRAAVSTTGREPLSMPDSLTPLRSSFGPNPGCSPLQPSSPSTVPLEV